MNNQKLWNFELGSKENMNVPIWKSVGFQKRYRQDSQNLNNESFCRLSVTSAQCIAGTEKDPDAGIIIRICDDDYSLHGHGQIKESYKALTKDDILQPKKFDDEFRSLNAGVVHVGYDLYVFDVRYHENFTDSQTIKVEFNFFEVIPNDINGYALVLTNKLVSIGSDGQKHFDLIKVIFNVFMTLSFSFSFNSVFFSKASLYLSGKLFAGREEIVPGQCDNSVWYHE